MGMQTSFPLFEADQVLTNNHLNDLRKYLDEQNRFTRNKLLGAGIVCGLHITRTNDVLKVSKGCGLTSQGYLIMVCDSEFSHFIPYEPAEFPNDIDFIQQCGAPDVSSVPFYKPAFNDQMWQFITTQQFEQLSPADKANARAFKDIDPGDLDAWVLVAFLESEQLKLKNCDTNDCNDKGSRLDFEIKILLIHKKTLDAVGNGGGVPARSLPRIELGRYNVPVRNVLDTPAVLAAFATVTNDNIIEKIDEALQQSYLQYQDLLGEPGGNPFGGIGNTLKQLRNNIRATNPLWIQYFYDFLDDIIKAYHEFRDKVISVRSECCIDEMRFPLHLMLGEAGVNTSLFQTGAYRQYFIYSPLLDAQRNRSDEMRFLFTRLKLIILRYTPGAPGEFGGKLIKITPSQYGKPWLSKRCIPYYYDVASTAGGPALYQYWDFQKTARGEPDQNLSYRSDDYADPSNLPVTQPLLFDIEKYNFFRVEGHIGKQISNALTDVVSLRQQLNLPMEVIALSADYIGAILKGEDPKCVIQDLESDYRIIIAEFMCKLHDAFCSIYSLPFKPKPSAISAAAAALIAPVKRAARTAAPAAGDEVTARAAALAGVAEEEEDELKELVTKTNFAGVRVDHPVLSRLVSEVHLTKNYVKGSSLLRICGVKKGSIGEIYHSNIARNVFSNPVSLNTNIKGASLYFRFFELIDCIESMFEILLTHELAELDMQEFRAAYARFEKEVENLSKQLRVITEDKVQIFLSTCIIEKLEALKDEYKRRISQHQLAQKFNNYFRQHGGLEHKAGVTKGGTFILVYYEETRNRKFDVGSLFVNRTLGKLMLAKHPDLLEKNPSDAMIKIAADELQAGIASQSPESFSYFNNAVKDFLDKDAAIPLASRDALLAAIRKPPQRQRFPFPSGTVIADFYVPYICCSDCSPITYVLQPPEPLPIKIVAAPPQCNTEGTKYTVSLHVTGGIPPYTYLINNVVQPDNNIVLDSGSADTKVVVEDSTGKTAEEIIRSHTCPVPCLLPCGGAAHACRYVLWVARPDAGFQVSHIVANATIVLTDENGQITEKDLTQLFQEVFGGVQNILTSVNYSETFKRLCKKLNEIIPDRFMDAEKQMFKFEPETRLLIIDRFDCQRIKMQVQVRMKFDHASTSIIAVYHKDGVTLMDNVNQLTTEVPLFGCVQMNKCTGEKRNLCDAPARITEITGNQEEFGQPFYRFEAKPEFDHWCWYFHSGVPIFSDAAKPQHIRITPTNDGKALVRVIGIKKGTGCFALREEKIMLGNIIE